MSSRVLIASNVSDSVRNFCGGYQALGYEPIAGRINFDLEIMEADILHILWPEELVNWQTPPTDAEIDIVKGRLDRWIKRSKLIFTVNNLYPHQHHGNQYFHRLYSAVLERADVIHHFGETSKSLVCAEYPAIADRNHVVRVGLSYERLLDGSPRDRERARRALGVKENEITFLNFGSLREWSEAKRLISAFDHAKIPGKRLLTSSHLSLKDSWWRSRARHLYWDLWRRRADITNIAGYVPDQKLREIFDAADVVLVVRENNLNSGIISLAMTFGRMVIAPNIGTMSEFVEGTRNPIYDATSWRDLTRAMEQAAAADREAIGAENAVIASGWNWKQIIETCVAALPK